MPADKFRKARSRLTPQPPPFSTHWRHWTLSILCKRGQADYLGIILPDCRIRFCSILTGDVIRDYLHYTSGMDRTMKSRRSHTQLDPHGKTGFRAVIGITSTALLIVAFVCGCGSGPGRRPRPAPPPGFDTLVHGDYVIEHRPEHADVAQRAAREVEAWRERFSETYGRLANRRAERVFGEGQALGGIPQATGCWRLDHTSQGR